MPNGRIVRPSVSVEPAPSYDKVDHRGDMRFGDPTITMQWGAGTPGGVVKPLATQAVEGGTRYHYTDGYLDDLSGLGANFVPQALATNVELLPGALDAMQARLGYLAEQGSNSTEQAQLGDYLARWNAAINAGDRPTLQAAVNSDLAAYSGRNLSVGNRLYNLGVMLNPNSPWAQVPSMKQSLIQFGLTTATGVAGLMTGGAAFTALRGAGTGLIVSGGGAGVVGDLTTQVLDNGVNLATGGKYGRSGINGTELLLSGGLGALPGTAGAARDAFMKSRVGQFMANTEIKVGFEMIETTNPTLLDRVLNPVPGLGAVEGKGLKIVPTLTIERSGQAASVEVADATIATEVLSREIPLMAKQLRNAPGIATATGDLPHVSGRWLDPSQPVQIPGQVRDVLEGKAFNTFDDMRSAILEQIGSHPELISSLSRANQARLRAGKAPFAPTKFHAESGAFGQRFNLHHHDPVSNGGAVYDLSNLRIVSPKTHFDMHYGPGN